MRTFTVRYRPPPRFKPGDRFMRLTILAELPERSARYRRVYRVLCDCGTIKTVRSTDMRVGRTMGCGCARGGDQKSWRARAKRMPTPAEIALAALMRADAQHEPWV
jgi:hypothetical protein